MKSPSPARLTTQRSGYSSAAATAAGTPYPIAPDVGASWLRPCCASPRVFDEAVQPAAVVAGTVGVDGVVGQQPLQCLDDLGHVERSDRVGPEVGTVIGTRRGRPVGPRHLFRRCQRCQRVAGAGHARLQHQVGRIDPAQFLGAGMQVHQRLGRTRRLDQRIAAGRHLAQPRADRDQQVGLAHPLRQLRIDADAHVTGVVGMAVVEQILEAEGTRHRQLPGLGEALQCQARRRVPAAAAGDHQRALRGQQPLAQFAQCRRSRPALRCAHPRQHRSAQSSWSACLRAAPARPDRAGPARRCGRRAPHIRAGDRRRAPRRPTWPCQACRGRTSAGSRPPGRPRGRAGRWPPGRRTAPSACCPGRQCAARCSHWWRPDRGSRNTRPGNGPSLPWASAMNAGAAFLATGDEADAIAVRVKAVEHRQVAFARNAEAGLDALLDQRLDEQVPGKPGLWTG